MRLLPNMFPLTALLLLAGCGSITYERSRFDGNRLSNPTLGSGVYYQLPEGYSVLNPWSPVPPKKENARFEAYLRGITAANDQDTTHHAFQEALLFRQENRYLWIRHAAVNRSETFRNMHPARRALLLPKVAAESYRYFEVPPSDFHYSIEQERGRTIILYQPLKLQTAKVGEDWRSIGFTMLGDQTDLVEIRLFARERDLPAAQADLRALLDHFSYGKPLP
jgi:hypothetical protein